MNIPIQILKRSFQLILADPVQTLKVVLPGMILTALGLAFLVLGLGGLGEGGSTDLETLNAPLLVMALLAGVTGWIVFAVFWHRYALLRETNRAGVMRPSIAVFRQYLKAGLVVGLMIFALIVVGSFAFGMVASIMLANADAFATIVITVLVLVLIVLLSWFSLRISLVLPAACVGHEMSVSDSLAATKPAQYNIFWVAMILVILSRILKWLCTELVILAPGSDFFVALAMVVIKGLVYVSVLSTLYGHYIEGRSLT